MSSTTSLPAILDGEPINPDGPPSWPVHDPDVVAALQHAYESGVWGQYHGGLVPELESKLADFHQVAHAVTCGSGTAAIEASLRTLRVGQGDEVILAAYDYPGNFLSVHAVGGHPVLVDLDPENWNLDINKVDSALSAKTKAILASHIHGGLVPMQQLMDLARDRKIPVVEDAAQATGALIDGRTAGTWGDLGVISFGGSKLLTAGRGGAVLTNEPQFQQRLKLHFIHGNHISPLSELQAAVLFPQLKKLPARNHFRHQQILALTRSISEIPGLRIFSNSASEWTPAYYKVGFQFDEEHFGIPRQVFVAALRAEGFAFDEGFRSLHVGRSAKRYRAIDALPEATRAHHGVVALYHPVLLHSENVVSQISQAIRKIFRHKDELKALHVEKPSAFD
ncbi:MAG: DegT/DnrJ/EryC1/StrS family aminotransferase [Gemmataceae bacterium]